MPCFQHIVLVILKVSLVTICTMSRESQSALLGPVQAPPEKEQRKKPWVFKLQISPEEQRQLYEEFDFSTLKEKTYIYFDTDEAPDSAMLHKHNTRLRVKIKESGKYVLELKSKDERRDANREIAQDISAEEFKDLLGGDFPLGEVQDRLVALGLFRRPPIRVDSVLSFRQKAKFREGQLVLDMTTKAQGKMDTTLEFRSAKKYSLREVDDLIGKLGISNNPVTKSKLDKLWEDKSH